MYLYQTRSKDKAVALFASLIDAEFSVTIGYAEPTQSYMLVTNATEEQFKVVRSQIGIPSSNPSGLEALVVEVPDTIPKEWGI